MNEQEQVTYSYIHTYNFKFTLEISGFFFAPKESMKFSYKGRYAGMWTLLICISTHFEGICYSHCKASYVC
jgi:hypothetical protein